MPLFLLDDCERTTRVEDSSLHFQLEERQGAFSDFSSLESDTQQLNKYFLISDLYGLYLF